jgi:hypothetical protein
MGQFPSSGGGGGSESILEKGDPVNVFVGSGSSVTVPSDKDWIVTVDVYSGGSNVKYILDGSDVVKIGSGQIEFESKISGGSTISEGVNGGGFLVVTGVEL